MASTFFCLILQLTIVVLVYFSSSSYSSAIILEDDFINEVKQKCKQFLPSSYTPNCPYASENQSNGTYPCHPIKIQFLFIPNKLTFFDDKEEEVGISGYSRWFWNAKCSNLSKHPIGWRSLRSSANHFWHPEVYHDNAVSDFAMSSLMKRQFIFNNAISDDLVGFSLQIIGLYSSQCDLNMDNYPFDHQNCSIQFILYEDPVVYSIELKEDSDERRYVGTNLISSSSNWMLLQYDYQCMVAKVGPINKWKCQVWFHVKRKPANYIITFMLPATFLSFLQLLAFCLEHNQGERPMFALTIVLASTLLKGEMLDVMPDNSNYIFLSLYFDFCFLFSWISTVYFLIINFIDKKIKANYEKPEKTIKNIERTAFVFLVVAFVIVNCYSVVRIVNMSQ